jgi:PAS domain S-box-containing protein
LAFVIKKPFEGQLQAVTVLGIVELLVVGAIIRSVWLNWKHHRSPLPVALVAAHARKQLTASFMSQSTMLMGIVSPEDGELRHIYDSDSACRFYGVPPGESVGKRSSELPVGKNLDALLLERCRESLAERKPIYFKGSVIHEGQRRWFVGEVVPIQRDLIVASRLSYALRDVSELTEARNSEQKLRSKLAFQRRIVDLARAGAGVDTIAQALSEVARELLPGDICCIIEEGTRRNTVHQYPSPGADDTQVLFEHLASEHNRRALITAGADKDDVTLSDLAAFFDAETSAACSARSLCASRIRAIRLSPGNRWGFVVCFYPCQQHEDESCTAELREVVLHSIAMLLERTFLVSKLEEETTRIRLAERAGKVGLWDWDIKTNNLIWSEQMYALHSVQSGQPGFSYSDWAALAFAEDVKIIEADLQERFKRHDPAFYGLYRFRSPDERVHSIESSGAIYYDSDGAPTRLIGAAFDTTDRLNLLRQVEEDRRRLELVLEAGQLGFWDWKISTESVEYGGLWFSMLGYDPKEVAPTIHSWESLVHPDDMPGVLKELKAQLDGKKPAYEAEYRLKKKDGSWLWTLGRGRVVERDPSGRPLRALGIQTDISEQREARETLRLAAQRKDEFLATLAHELRNPLAPIRTGLSLLKKNPFGPEAPRTREIMQRQVEHMVRLIDDLFDVARITQGRLRLKHGDLVLQEIVESAVEASRPIINAANHTLHVHMPEQPIKLRGDTVRLCQVITNLLSNAAKYTPDGGTISLIVSRQNGTAQITIKDNGLGIPPDMLESVFNMFGQVNKTLERSQGGLGIGLALVRKIAELHGGDVRASSDGEDKGSTFIVHLPVYAAETVVIPSAPPAPAEPAPFISQRVLVVDDNEDGAESLALFMSMMGHTVDVAHSAEEALESLKAPLPRVIFLDIGLPGMSGYEAAKAIRKLPHGDEVTLIALTGWGAAEDKARAQEAGFSEHLTKPVDLLHVERILGTTVPAKPPQGAVQPPAP